MRIGVIVPLTRQPGATEPPAWPEIREYILHAEALGVRSAWVFDHLYSGNGTAPPEAIHEAWTIQTALAAVTSRIELGQLVTCTSFRNPGLLAKMAVTTDEISGNRLTLGLGAGWYDDEYRAFGFPTDYRASRFSESLDIILPLLRGETVTMDGRFHRADDVRLLPAPARRIPVMIAGQKPRMRALVAKHADAWNTAWYPAPDDVLATRMADMRASLDEAGRDHASLRWTVGMPASGEDTASMRRAIEAFADLAIDDLIISLRPASLGALDRLAKAAAAWL